MKSLEIRRLHIRTRGLPPRVARELVGGLPRALLLHLGRTLEVQGCSPGTVDALDAGTVPVARGTQTCDLHRKVAERIAGQLWPGSET